MARVAGVNPPIRVAEMVIQHRVSRLQIDGPLQGLRRFRKLSELEMSPAQTVDNIAVVAPQFDRPAEHFERFFQIDAAINPSVAKIIENERLIRNKLHGSLY